MLIGWTEYCTTQEAYNDAVNNEWFGLPFCPIIMLIIVEIGTASESWKVTELTKQSNKHYDQLLWRYEKTSRLVI